MNKKTYFLISGLVFAIVAVVHLLRNFSASLTSSWLHDYF